MWRQNWIFTNYTIDPYLMISIHWKVISLIYGDVHRWRAQGRMDIIRLLYIMLLSCVNAFILIEDIIYEEPFYIGQAIFISLDAGELWLLDTGWVSIMSVEVLGRCLYFHWDWLQWEVEDVKVSPPPMFLPLHGIYITVPFSSL